ncbi:MAG: hypothetical protein AB1391_02630 [Candidatus Micrarchaeota archaeon]
MGFFDFLFGWTASEKTIPRQYRSIVNVFKAKIPTDSDEASVNAYFQDIISKLSHGGKEQQSAAKALQSFIDGGGAKYFVKTVKKSKE